MKVFIALISYFVVLPLSLQASNAALFAVDEQEIIVNMTNLTKLENLVINKKLDLAELQQQYPEYLQNLSLDDDPTIEADPEESVFGIPSVIWGFCLGLIGVMIVVVNSNGNKQYVTQSILGCAGCFAFWALILILQA